METDKFRRDPMSKGLISRDIDGLSAYKTKRQRLKKIEIMESNIQTMTAEMSSIKTMLQTLLQRNECLQSD